MKIFQIFNTKTQKVTNDEEKKILILKSFQEEAIF